MRNRCFKRSSQRPIVFGYMHALPADQSAGMSRCKECSIACLRGSVTCVVVAPTAQKRKAAAIAALPLPRIVRHVMDMHRDQMIPYDTPTGPASWQPPSTSQQAELPANLPLPDASSNPDGGGDSDSSGDSSDADSEADGTVGGSTAPALPRDEGRQFVQDSRLLAVSNDSSEGTYGVPYRLPTQKKWRFAFIGFHFMQFSDGRALAGFSSGCWCGAPSDLHSLVEGIDRHADPKSWLTEPRMCRCSVTLLAWIGGERHLQEQLQAATQQYRSEQDIKHQLPGRWAAYTAVRAGNSFADWCVMDTCADKKFEKKLAEHLDAVTGQRRLRGLSWQHLPEEPHTDPELRRILTGRFQPDGSCSLLTLNQLQSLTNLWMVHRCMALNCPRLVDCRARRGIPVPARCEPDTATACSLCGACEWCTNQPAVSSTLSTLVFLSGAAVRTTFVSYTCGGSSSDGSACSGVLSVDCKEHGLLRYTARLAFGLCLLYNWANTLVDGGVPCFTFWKRTLLSYRG